MGSGFKTAVRPSNKTGKLKDVPQINLTAPKINQIIYLPAKGLNLSGIIKELQFPGNAGGEETKRNRIRSAGLRALNNDPVKAAKLFINSGDYRMVNQILKKLISGHNFESAGDILMSAKKYKSAQTYYKKALTSATEKTIQSGNVYSLYQLAKKFFKSKNHNASDKWLSENAPKIILNTSYKYTHSAFLQAYDLLVKGVGEKEAVDHVFTNYPTKRLIDKVGLKFVLDRLEYLDKKSSEYKDLVKGLETHAEKLSPHDSNDVDESAAKKSASIYEALAKVTGQSKKYYSMAMGVYGIMLEAKTRGLLFAISKLASQRTVEGLFKDVRYYRNKLAGVSIKAGWPTASKDARRTKRDIDRKILTAIENINLDALKINLDTTGDPRFVRNAMDTITFFDRHFNISNNYPSYFSNIRDSYNKLKDLL